jgi:anthranilate/para-aminobenzoate synthase component I
MTIRTIVVDGQKATIGVGGGITIDSQPTAELEETKLKAAALLRALNAPNPWSTQ